MISIQKSLNYARSAGTSWFLLILGALSLDSNAASIKAPESLRSAKVPVVPGLLSGQNPIVLDPKAAIALGKAFFWDQGVGSDGIACGTCHFHAGVDGRIRNQLGRAPYHGDHGASVGFGEMASGRLGTLNYTPSSTDFPFTQFLNPKDNESGLTFQTDNVLGSAGVFERSFVSITFGGEWDVCHPVSNSFFQQGGLLYRQVGQRNAPNVINAVFNYRNFWDGRANNVFNGESPWGTRDLQAGIWVQDSMGGLVKRRLLLPNAALASQAVAPIVNSEEMSCSGRGLQATARRVLSTPPLSRQMIASSDSVLGTLRSETGYGLSVDYPALIRKSFSRRFWASERKVGGDSSQMEANFPFFLGLAIQMYESTLISDQAPFDSPKDADGYPRALTAKQRRGQDVFINRLCVNCHTGPAFTLASSPSLLYRTKNPNGPSLVDRMVVNGAVPGTTRKGEVTQILFDRGFANTSVTPTSFDPGLAAEDVFGNPLSFVRQYLNVLEGERAEMVDPLKVFACDFLDPFTLDFLPSELIDDPTVTSPSKCRKSRLVAKVPKGEVLMAEEAKPARGRALSMIHGAFKIPSLRNVELTGPYMHNGGMKSLGEVVDFYDRGGNVSNEEHFATLVLVLGLSEQEKSDLIDFLRSLTDERVRWEKAPFDHPSIDVPEGGENRGVGAILAVDQITHVPAVGREGRSSATGPLLPFDERLKNIQPR